MSERRRGPPRNKARRSPEPAEPVRLQKALADAGLGSRREIEGWISAGRVRVNGVPAKLGDRVTPTDRIQIDGREVERHAVSRMPLRVIAYNKPEGEVVTRDDPQGRPTVFARLPRLKVGRWIAVGRLDLNTSGLLLLTNQGELANRLMHPSREVEREYAVRILGEVPPATLQRLVDGIELDDGPARFERIVEAGGEGANRWYHVSLREGRNREVRRLWEAAGCPVSRLIRLRYGNVGLGPRLFTGHWRELSEEEIAGLLALAGLGHRRAERPQRAAEAGRGGPWGRPRERGPGVAPPARSRRNPRGR